MFRDKIKEICKERGISIRELERRAGLGEGTVKKWKDFTPRADNLLKVAKVLEVSMEELLDGETA